MISVASPNDGIRFVKNVDKACVHLGSIRQEADNEGLFGMWEAFAAVDSGPVFADNMRAQARDAGANRLVIVDIFHNKTIYSGARTGYGETVDATELRARAYKCPQ